MGKLRNTGLHRLEDVNKEKQKICHRIFKKGQKCNSFEMIGKRGCDGIGGGIGKECIEWY